MAEMNWDDLPANSKLLSQFFGAWQSAIVG